MFICHWWLDPNALPSVVGQVGTSWGSHPYLVGHRLYLLYFTVFPSLTWSPSVTSL
jgi:hypothetical protein